MKPEDRQLMTTAAWLILFLIASGIYLSYWLQAHKGCRYDVFVTGALVIYENCPQKTQ